MMANRNMGLHMKRVAIYLRVSTSKQDTYNQRRECWRLPPGWAGT